MKGRVKSFNEERGFGFIRGEDSKEYFVHITDILDNQLLARGRMVEFDPDINEKGYIARAVFVYDSISTHPTFVDFGSTRIKLSNIKNYGISSTLTYYGKVFDKRQYLTSKNTLFGAKTVRRHGFVDTGERVRLGESREGAAAALCYSIKYQTYYRYVKDNGKIVKHSPPLMENWSFEDVIECKNVNYLYVTTYQNDNYRFVEDLVPFDIQKKCNELDEYVL